MTIAVNGRIAFGTAQLGLPYGVRANEPVMTEGAAFALLDEAWQAGIRDFDTAAAYGSAPERLSKWLERGGKLTNARVTTKIAPLSDREERRSAIHSAVGKFLGASGVSLLAHGAIQATDVKLWRQSAHDAVATDVKIGASVYGVDEARAVCRGGGDVVQLPLCALDIAGLKQFTRLRCRRVQVRSIFLQGLLTQEPDKAERRVPGARDIVAQVQAICREMAQPPQRLLLASMHALLPERALLVLGAETPSQIEDWVAALSISADVAGEAARRFSTIAAGQAIELFDPRRWPVPPSFQRGYQ